MTGPPAPAGAVGPLPQGPCFPALGLCPVSPGLTTRLGWATVSEVAVLDSGAGKCHQEWQGEGGKGWWPGRGSFCPSPAPPRSCHGCRMNATLPSGFVSLLSSEALWPGHPCLPGRGLPSCWLWAVSCRYPVGVTAWKLIAQGTHSPREATAQNRAAYATPHGEAGPGKGVEGLALPAPDSARPSWSGHACPPSAALEGACAKAMGLGSCAPHTCTFLRATEDGSHAGPAFSSAALRERPGIAGGGT